MVCVEDAIAIKAVDIILDIIIDIIMDIEIVMVVGMETMGFYLGQDFFLEHFFLYNGCLI